MRKRNVLPLTLLLWTAAALGTWFLLKLDLEGQTGGGRTNRFQSYLWTALRPRGEKVLVVPCILKDRMNDRIGKAALFVFKEMKFAPRAPCLTLASKWEGPNCSAFYGSVPIRVKGDATTQVIVNIGGVSYASQLVFAFREQYKPKLVYDGANKAQNRSFKPENGTIVERWELWRLYQQYGQSVSLRQHLKGHALACRVLRFSPSADRYVATSIEPDIESEKKLDSKEFHELVELANQVSEELLKQEESSLRD